MTLEDAIRKCKEVADNNIAEMEKYDAASGYSRTHDESIRSILAVKCEKRAERYRQIAEWLTELKEIRNAPKKTYKGAYIKDLTTGNVREYGADRHDSLCISESGRYLSYYNLQCGEGSAYGCYRFTDENGKTPEEDEDHNRYGEHEYFNIGGFDK